MDNNELDIYEEEQIIDSCDTESLDDMQDDKQLDTNKICIGVGVIGSLFGIFMGIKSWRTDRALKKERANNKLFQEALRKHQAEINDLKKAKERKEYENLLWEELMTKSEE